VVDDSTEFRVTLCQALELQGYRVLGASNGDEALSILADQPADAVITDLSMPGLNGLEFLRTITERPTERPRIVVMTGNQQVSDAVKRELVTLGTVAVLRKPFSVEELIHALPGTRGDPSGR
jgi:CheY-like chemotaxis protein